MFSVHVSDEARRFYEKAERPLVKKLAKAFDQLERDPRQSNNSKMLVGPLAGHWRYRVGDYRIIYRIDDPSRMVFIINIAHRREVYE